MNNGISKCDAMGCIGNIINKCPSCNFKNITYSFSCDSCGFSWEEYVKQEKINICDSCTKEIPIGKEYGTDEENDKVYCKECVD